IYHRRLLPSEVTSVNPCRVRSDTQIVERAPPDNRAAVTSGGNRYGRFWRRSGAQACRAGHPSPHQDRADHVQLFDDEIKKGADAW
ncbi:hypothetical protein, partial [Mesorhizobium sp.]|uniref:hypothetical protein n=1 Tax=Mesorhizobium sp. TaxID=1871066 RepID=UPI0025D14096